MNNSINNTLDFLDSSAILQHENAERANENFSVEWIPASKADQRTKRFLSASRKFQEHFQKQKTNSEQLNSDGIIEEIKNFILTVPSGYYIFIGTTLEEENIKKLELNVPSYWYYKKMEDYQSGRTIFQYFQRRVYKSHINESNEHDCKGNCVFAFALPRYSEHKSANYLFGFIPTLIVLLLVIVASLIHVIKVMALK